MTTTSPAVFQGLANLPAQYQGLLIASVVLALFLFSAKSAFKFLHGVAVTLVVKVILSKTIWNSVVVSLLAGFQNNAVSALVVNLNNLVAETTFWEILAVTAIIVLNDIRSEFSVSNDYKARSLNIRRQQGSSKSQGH